MIGTNPSGVLAYTYVKVLQVMVDYWKPQYFIAKVVTQPVLLYFTFTYSVLLSWGFQFLEEL